MLFNIPLPALQEVNDVKNPIVYKIITFFLTQSNPQNWDLFNLIEKLSSIKFDTPKKKNRVFKAIEKHKELLSKYGITIEEKTEGKNKKYLIHYRRKKLFPVEFGNHVKP